MQAWCTGSGCVCAGGLLLLRRLWPTLRQWVDLLVRASSAQGGTYLCLGQQVIGASRLFSWCTTTSLSVLQHKANTTRGPQEPFSGPFCYGFPCISLVIARIVLSPEKPSFTWFWLYLVFGAVPLGVGHSRAVQRPLLAQGSASVR